MDNKQETKKGWLTVKLEDWEFRRSFERELVAELFVSRIEHAMTEQELNKTELAKRMECSLANVSRAMRKTTNMTIATMVDMALSLNLRVRVELEPLAIEECAFASPVTPVTPEMTWPPVIQHEEYTTNPEGFVVYFQAKQHIEATQEGTSVSRALWNQSARETEVPSQLLESLFA